MAPLTRAHLKVELSRSAVRLKLNKVGVAARKEWLTSNCRSAEVLDQEFYL